MCRPGDRMVRVQVNRPRAHLVLDVEPLAARPVGSLVVSLGCARRSLRVLHAGSPNRRRLVDRGDVSGGVGLTAARRLTHTLRRCAGRFSRRTTRTPPPGPKTALEDSAGWPPPGLRLMRTVRRSAPYGLDFCRPASSGTVARASRGAFPRGWLTLRGSSVHPGLRSCRSVRQATPTRSRGQPSVWSGIVRTAWGRNPSSGIADRIHDPVLRWPSSVACAVEAALSLLRNAAARHPRRAGTPLAEVARQTAQPGVAARD